MKTPRWTDAHKYPRGYANSASTDVAATIRRVLREQAEAAKARKSAVVQPMRKGAK